MEAPYIPHALPGRSVFNFLSQRHNRLCHFISDNMDYFWAGEDPNLVILSALRKIPGADEHMSAIMTHSKIYISDFERCWASKPCDNGEIWDMKPISLMPLVMARLEVHL